MNFIPVFFLTILLFVTDASGHIAEAKAFNSCDSVYVDTVVSCSAFYWDVTDSSYASSGIYSDTLQGSWGCDSVRILDLEIVNIDTTVYYPFCYNNLVANDTSASYQWLNCDSGMAPVPGANDRVFFSNYLGIYAVVLSKGNCIDTSACIRMCISGLETNNSEKLILYPNPSRDKLFLEIPDNLEIHQARIVSMTGATIAEVAVEDLSQSIDLKKLKSGMYYFVLEGNDFKEELKFIKE